MFIAQNPFPVFSACAQLFFSAFSAAGRRGAGAPDQAQHGQRIRGRVFVVPALRQDGRDFLLRRRRRREVAARARPRGRRFQSAKSAPLNDRQQADADDAMKSSIAKGVVYVLKMCPSASQCCHLRCRGNASDAIWDRGGFPLRTVDVFSRVLSACARRVAIQGFDFTQLCGCIRLYTRFSLPLATSADI